MSIVRFNLDEVFEVDSQEYEVLINAAERVGTTEGAIVEIGTRRGGSARMIIDALVNTNNTNRSMFCIDPYGNIEIDCTNLNMSIHYPGTKVEGNPESKEITSPHRFDYTNNMRNRIIPSLYYYAYSNGLNFNFFCLEDTEFFNRYGDGVPVYDNKKTVLNKYAFVFFDGPHDNKALKTEVEFFESRTNVGSIFVMDDIWMYDHDKVVEEYLFPRGWEILEKKSIKASYIKRK